MTFDNPLFTPSRLRDEHRRPPPRRLSEDRDAYVFHDGRIANAVNVAMAARRPLLVTGLPGSGKSSLARAVAREKNWTYVEHVVTSRTELADLTAGFDAVRRLADAQLHRLLPDWCVRRARRAVVGFRTRVSSDSWARSGRTERQTKGRTASSA